MKREAEIKEKRRVSGGKGLTNRWQSDGKAIAKRLQKPEYEYEVENDSLRVELEEYAATLGLPKSDGAACYFKWQANGWTNNGQKIKDPKATLRSWKAFGYLPSQKLNKNAIVFQRPKEKAPIYDKPPPTRETTEEEWAEQRRIVREASAKLREQMHR